MLLSNNLPPRQAAKAKTIALAQIAFKKRIREHFADPPLRQMAQSLADDGQLQPVGVQWDPASSMYNVIYGERRVRAAILAGLETVECVVHDEGLTEADIILLQIAENEHRESLRPMEQARAYGLALKLNQLNGKQLAERLSKSESTVSRALGLLDLPEELQQKVDDGVISVVQALKLHRASLQSKKKPFPTTSKPAKEKKFTTSAGVTVTFKARKLLQGQSILQALRELLATLEASQNEVTA